MNIERTVTEIIITLISELVMHQSISIEKFPGSKYNFELGETHYVISLTKENIWALQKEGKLVEVSENATQDRYEAIKKFTKWIENDRHET